MQSLPEQSPPPRVFQPGTPISPARPLLLKFPNILTLLDIPPHVLKKQSLQPLHIRVEFSTGTADYGCEFLLADQVLVVFLEDPVP